jgi:tRNA threonylcarbamoyl adenosine modification protein (Sua5/YciO/YrdC/YwlC family)
MQKATEAISNSLKAMLLEVHPENPQGRHINTIAEHLANGGLIIYPTDTVYGLGCDIYHREAIEKICQIKQVDPRKAKLSFICHSLSDMSVYAKSISTPMFRLLKHHVPGPYTFIFPASKQTPKILKSKKDTVGIRVPDNNIAQAIVRALGHPVLSTSVPGNSIEECTDPEIMYQKFQKQVNIVVNAGIGGIIPSTIVDLTGPEPMVLREGLGEFPKE